jgi:hypothetical protein
LNSPNSFLHGPQIVIVGSRVYFQVGQNDLLRASSAVEASTIISACLLIVSVLSRTTLNFAMPHLVLMLCNQGGGSFNGDADDIKANASKSLAISDQALILLGEE